MHEVDKRPKKRRAKVSLNAVRGGNGAVVQVGLAVTGELPGCEFRTRKVFVTYQKQFLTHPGCPNLKVQREQIHLHVLEGGSAKR